MSLSAAAAALGLPEALVQRSAEARAAETGRTVDEVLAAWAGGEPVATTAPPAEPEPAPVEAPAAEEGGQESVEEPAITPPEPAPAATPAPGTAPQRSPVPAQVGVAEAAHLPEVITVPTAGIKERTNFVIPRWLSALMLIAPLVALFALGGAATGTCGEATELRTNVITGQIENCDGSEFTGSGAGGGGTDFVALGGELYVGAVTPAANCAGCHGPNGEGGVGPGFGGVLTTFSVCEDHVEWVRLGSEGWRSEVGDTYGDTNKPVTVGMPPHAALTEEQLRSVVSFERVRFGGANPDETLVDCGLAEPAGEEGGETGETGETEEGDDGTTGTTIPETETTTAP